MVIVVFVAFDAVPVKAPVKLVALIFIADKLVMDALDALINDPVIIVLPFAIVVKDTFLNDALNTFINAVDGIEKFPITERFTTDILFTDAFDALINVFVFKAPTKVVAVKVPDDGTYFKEP